MVFDVTKAKKAMEAARTAGEVGETAHGSGLVYKPKLGRLIGPGALGYANFAKLDPVATGCAVKSQNRIANTMSGLQGVAGRQLVRTSGNAPSLSPYRVPDFFANRIASQQPKISGADNGAWRFLQGAPRPSYAGLLGDSFTRTNNVVGGLKLVGNVTYQERGWQALGPYGKHDRAMDWSGSAAGSDLLGSALAGSRVPRPEFGASGTIRGSGQAFGGLHLLGSPAVGSLTSLMSRYAETWQRLSGGVASWDRPFAGVFERLRRALELAPRDSDGEPVSPWNAGLYRLARAAYYGGNYAILARFLDEIGADGSADNVLKIQDLLRPAFEPRRSDRRVEWWRMDPREARNWLNERLRGRNIEVHKEEKLRRKREPSYDGMDRSMVRYGTHEVAAEAEYFRMEREAMLQHQLGSVFSERQCEVLTLIALGWKYELIAEYMGIGVSTVKTHVHRTRKHPELLKDPEAVRILLR
ncbi:MAG: sigma factor-like helix-turn-helix DNA-binding protein [Rubrobacteraceae bacterium]